MKVVFVAVGQCAALPNEDIIVMSSSGLKWSLHISLLLCFHFAAFRGMIGLLSGGVYFKLTARGESTILMHWRMIECYLCVDVLRATSLGGQIQLIIYVNLKFYIQ